MKEMIFFGTRLKYQSSYNKLRPNLSTLVPKIKQRQWDGFEPYINESINLGLHEEMKGFLFIEHALLVDLVKTA